MNFIKRMRASSSSSKGIALILGGTAISQIIVLAALPVLTRLYSPEAFGILSFMLAISGIIVPVASLRLETVVLLPEKAAETRIVTYVASVSIIMVTIMTALVLFGADRAGIFSLRDIPYAPFWIASLVLLTSSFNLISQLALRKRGYSETAKRSIVQSIGTTFGQITAAAFTRTGLGLLSGAVVGKLFGIIALIRYTSEFWGFASRREALKTLKKYWRFPLIFTPSHFLNGLGMHVPLLFLTYRFGLEAGGQVGMAERIVAVPLTLIGGAVGQVFGAELGLLVRNGSRETRKLLLHTTRTLLFVAVPVGIAVAALGPTVFPFVLGEEWAIAGIFAQAMSITVVLRLVANPIGWVFPLYQKSALIVKLDTTRVGLLGSSIALVVVFDLGLYPSIWVLYGSLGITYLITWFAAYYVVQRASSEGS